jgi:ATP/ADP translocase
MVMLVWCWCRLLDHTLAKNLKKQHRPSLGLLESVKYLSQSRYLGYLCILVLGKLWHILRCTEAALGFRVLVLS